jgi:hypothetical protein
VALRAITFCTAVEQIRVTLLYASVHTVSTTGEPGNNKDGSQHDDRRRRPRNCDRNTC